MMLAATGAPPVNAQEQPPAQLAAPLVPGSPAESAPSVTPGPAQSGQVARGAPTTVAGSACTCGDRRGLSRWRWHRRECKRHLQEKFLGFAEEFNEWPLGEATYAHGRTQVANGLAARMAFHQCDFVDGTSQLNYRGRDKLATIAAALPTTFFPVVVERTQNQPDLDVARRALVLAELRRGSFPVAEERVLIGPRLAYGMTGYEAYMAIYPRQIRDLAAGGSAGGPGGEFVGGGLGFDAGGLSGSAVTSVAPMGAGR
jgi:hypothetical protein